MNEYSSLKLRLYFTGLVTLAIWSLLAWNHFHGGVPSHHILARKDLPEISNWWGGLLLPLLTWFLLYRIHKRESINNSIKLNDTPFSLNVMYGFVAAVFFGVLLSTLFTFGSPLTSYILLSVFPLAMFFPIYRAEYLLGFVIGMSFTFGAVLPTAIGSILALFSAVLYLYIRPAIIYTVSKFVSIFQ